MRKVLIMVLIFLLLNVNLLQAAIDVGAPCIDRAGTAGGLYTHINCENPANASGVIDHIDVWMVNGVANPCEFASFFLVSGTNFSTRGNTNSITLVTGDNDLNAPGDFTAFDINTGDYIGIRLGASGTWVEFDDAVGQHGIWYRAGDNIPCTNQTFTLYTTGEISLYATGTESGAPPAPKVQSQILILE